MIKITLDTNCLIDLDEERENAQHVRCITSAAAHGVVDIAVTVSSASERQKDGQFLENIEHFRARMARLGLGGVPLLPSILRYNIGFWENGLWCDNAMAQREAEIYTKLFPSSPVEWKDYAAARGVSPEEQTGNAYLRWRNQILDAQAFWAHEHHRRDIFTTSDRRFFVLRGAEGFLNADIRSPQQVCEFLNF